MNNEIIIKKEGNVTIVNNVKEYSDSYVQKIEEQKELLSNMESDEDFENGKRFIKDLETVQKNIKEAEQKLFSEDIKKIREILTDLNKKCSSTKTLFKKEIDARKKFVIKNIIDNAWEIVEREINSNKDFDCSYFVNKDLFLNEYENSIKGKRSFEKIFEISQDLREKYIDIFEDKQNQYEKIENVFIEIYKKNDEVYTKQELKRVCYDFFTNNKDIDYILMFLDREVREKQEAREKEIIEKQRLENEKEFAKVEEKIEVIEKAQEVEKVIEKKKVIKNYKITFEMFETTENIEKVRGFMKNNNINYKRIN